MGFTRPVWTSLNDAFNVISSDNQMVGTRRRRRLFRDIWFFDCRCRRCSDPSENGSFLNGFKCRETDTIKLILAIAYSAHLSGRDQFDQIGWFIALWATFQSLCQQLFCPNRPHSLAIFVKVSNTFIIPVKLFWATFIDIWRLFTGHNGCDINSEFETLQSILYFNHKKRLLRIPHVWVLNCFKSKIMPRKFSVTRLGEFW